MSYRGLRVTFVHEFFTFYDTFLFRLLIRFVWRRLRFLFLYFLLFLLFFLFPPAPAAIAIAGGGGGGGGENFRHSDGGLH
jgi:hypothetical protein